MAQSAPLLAGVSAGVPSAAGTGVPSASGSDVALPAGASRKRRRVGAPASAPAAQAALVEALLAGAPPQAADEALAAATAASSAAGPTHIVTFAQELDALLGGGVRLGEVTELCGRSGSGKTQLALQLALDVQLPRLLGGCEGEAVFIDCEGAASPERLAQMAAAVSSHVNRLCRRFAKADRQALRAACAAPTLLAGVHMARCTTLAEQAACLHALPAFLRDHPRVRLVVLDSAAFHLRYGEAAASRDFRERGSLIAQLALQLNALAGRFGVAVVATNHMTTRFYDREVGPAELLLDRCALTLAASFGVPVSASLRRSSADGGFAGGLSRSSGGNSGDSNGPYGPSRGPFGRGFSRGRGRDGPSTAHIVPALGEHWAVCAARRLMLRIDTRVSRGERAGRRLAVLVKDCSGFREAHKSMGGEANFAVTEQGVRGLPPVVAAQTGAEGE